ncbi:MAG TPA: tyrosine-type recombinase/integrase [Candidatus Limnocylindria bacterium]|nr:tyrosine-type recombinase/integrase [Candidatus Limnocylindria bacterium]
MFRYRGRWRGLLSVGRIDGKRRRLCFDDATRADVEQRLVAARDARRRGTLICTTPPTLGQFAKGWLEEIAVRPLTRVNYRQKFEGHLVPELGGVRIDKLSASRLDEFFRAELRARGPHLHQLARPVHHPLSAQSVAHLRTVLHTALAQAVRYGHLASNPVELTRPIPVAQYEATFLSPPQARAFLRAAVGDRLEALYWVTLSLGLRQGEALALRWRDVDLAGRTLSVRATLQRHPGKGLVFSDPKTKKSRRTLPLPDVALRALRTHRARQDQERLAAGEAWRDHDLVFATRRGRPLSATHVMRASFRPLCERAGIRPGTRLCKGLRFHDLRHSAATLLLAEGVPQRVIMEVLGHSRITTSERYLHVATELAIEAAAAMDRALGAS